MISTSLRSLPTHSPIWKSLSSAVAHKKSFMEKMWRFQGPTYVTLRPPLSRNT